ncbi:MAG: (Fe-S)-binding protein [Smithellaceae bacterium]|nr:(Fe-S)-binding protein [Smithellaceae bacterium]
MENKALLSKDTEENIYHCIKCGLCLAHCPVYKEILLEEASPRGKVQLSRCLTDAKLELTEEIKDTFFSTCLLCGGCMANCPSGVHGTHLFSGIRWRAAQRYGIDWRKKALFSLLSNRWAMSKSAWFGRWARKYFGGPWIEKKLPAGALAVDRIPPFNEKPFSEEVEEVIKPAGTIRARVMYFHGCATNYLFGDIGRAVTEVLPLMGVAVTTPHNQICCGLPIFLSGDRTAALKCIRETLAIFAQPETDAVLVDCATCGAALAKEYPYLLKELQELGEGVTKEDIAAAELLAAKTQDVTVFIDEHKDWLPPFTKDKLVSLRVTFHDPCHLVKGQKISAPPRNILKSLPQVEYVEMAGADDCCGGGGSFQIEHPETSRKITERKINNIHNTGATVLSTCCPGCNLTISNHLDPAKSIATLHPVQLLRQALRGIGDSH